MSDELTQWADAARDYKAKLDWVTTALCDILELASGNKCDPDYTALEGLIAGTIESVRALKAELDASNKACAEMRDALKWSECETCNGSEVFTFECPGCLSGDGECTCDKQQPEPCPQCQQFPEIKAHYDARKHALSTDCGKDYVHKNRIRCMYCDKEYSVEQSAELADHIMSCDKSPLVQMVKEMESRITDYMDLMNDEFMRIVAITDNTEIVGICQRAMTVISQKEPVIKQRDELNSQVNRLHDELTRLRDIVSEADVALIDQALEETK